jgi:hypothetical protein
MQVAMVAASVASKGTFGAKYHTVSKASCADEALFGGKRTSTQAGALRSGPLDDNAASSDVVTISKGHLTRMMQDSPILTASQAREMKTQSQAAKDKERAHSKARKAKMLAMEEERKKQVRDLCFCIRKKANVLTLFKIGPCGHAIRRTVVQDCTSESISLFSLLRFLMLQVPPTETELLKQKADAEIVSRADDILAEQQDEAKAMDQMVLYAKCVTIRDAQLEEKKHMMLEEEAESRRLDTMMEIERVKALENYEERERQRKAERLIGAKVWGKKFPRDMLSDHRTECFVQHSLLTHSTRLCMHDSRQCWAEGPVERCRMCVCNIMCLVTSLLECRHLHTHEEKHLALVQALRVTYAIQCSNRHVCKGAPQMLH